MDQEQLKQRRNLRFMLLVVGPGMMLMLITSGEGLAKAMTAVLGFFYPMLLLAYVYFSSRQRCPNCRKPFALDLSDHGPLHRIYCCRYCGHAERRWGGNNSGGGGGP